jgi:hypothetical protein
VVFGIRKQIKKLVDVHAWDVRSGKKKKIVSKKMTLIITITQTENVQGSDGEERRAVYISFWPETLTG